MIKIIREIIDTNEILDEVKKPDAGGICLFLGTVRNKTGNKDVIRLEYEAYDSMALSEMEKIVRTAESRWKNCNIAVIHRTGVLKIGEIAVAIAVSAPHRDASFEACRFVIDTLKEKVPIWKKEIFEDGEEWVASHP